MRWCARCLMPDTRPRITFDERGVCNACTWAEEKRADVPWLERWAELEALCATHKARNADGFDCLVPVSGGKDSSYVAHQMKVRLGMRALAVTVAPPLPMAVGEGNLQRFIDTGFDHVRVTPNPDVARRIGRMALIEQGQPLLAWIIAVQTVVFRLAVQLDIPFVMFGEEGEVEYGGSTKLKSKAVYEVEDSIHLYLSGNDPKRFAALATEKELTWWRFPTADALRRLRPAVAHWSYFENWDPYAHYLYSKKYCGLQEEPDRCIGTYNNFAQTDTILYDLHTYLMYLKFGFGRCTQDVGIDIRRGAMNRKQALSLVKLYDGEYPERHIQAYRDYFKMTVEEFEEMLARHANADLFERKDGRWQPRFTPR